MTIDHLKSSLVYSELPERARTAIQNFVPDDSRIAERVEHFRYVQSRPADKDGDTEILDGVSFTHRFADAPGDDEYVRWHYVECGEGEPIVFLHGIPDSWFEWHHQMAALSTTNRCIAVDLKGYGQSDTRAGEYRHEGVADQLWALFQEIGLTRFNLVTHDRGTVQADFIVAKHPEAVIRYGRGEQHLFHFHPDLAPQGDFFREAPWTGLMEDPIKFIVFVYTWVTERQIPDHEVERVIQEFSYANVRRAVPRYFNNSTFRQEWLARRNRLLEAWRCPILIMQGLNSKTQPREFYEDARTYVPNAKKVDVKFLPGGHFWTLESPDETTLAIRHLLEM